MSHIRRSLGQKSCYRKSGQPDQRFASFSRTHTLPLSVNTQTFLKDSFVESLSKVATLPASHPHPLPNAPTPPLSHQRHCQGHHPSRSSTNSITFVGMSKQLLPPRSATYLCLSWYWGLFMMRSRGRIWMKTLLTQGAILCVWGDRKWTLSTRTVTHILQQRREGGFSE